MVKISQRKRCERGALFDTTGFVTCVEAVFPAKAWYTFTRAVTVVVARAVVAMRAHVAVVALVGFMVAD